MYVYLLLVFQFAYRVDLRDLKIVLMLYRITNILGLKQISSLLSLLSAESIDHYSVINNCILTS